MNYSDDAFHTFLDLDTVIYLAVYGTVTSLPVFIQNILNCVPKANGAFMGLERHGGCGLDFHKRCAFKLPNDCSRVYRRCGPSLSLFPPGRPRTPSLSSHTGGSLEEISMSKPSRSRPPSWADVPVSVGLSDGKEAQPRVPHTFHIHTYTKPTVCQYCFRLLKGLFRQGMQCSDCKFNCHRRCETLVPPDCRGEKANGEESDENATVVSVNDLYEELRYKDPPTADVTPLQPPNAPCFSVNIPLMRVVQSVKHSKRRNSGVLKKVFIMHLACASFQEISLSEVLQVRGPAQLTVPVLSGNSAHSFELVTVSLVYCVFADQDGPSWESALNQALRPVQGTVCHSTNNTGDGKSSEETQDISELYQIFSDEVLGSGQFGVVYGGTHRHTGRPVAIKVIDKTRFPTKQEEQTSNEVSILQRLSHPGVIHLEGMFKTMEYTFVVMEKLHSDMLEMILSHENGRLTERTTRFLVTQVLEALRYLHMRDVAHCDLKPENVLLASPEPFPQVKLCDFGFARIIGQKSFRHTLVGTPAYLAPEVICSKRYNRSLDVWAVVLDGYLRFFLLTCFSLSAVNLINNLLQVVVRRRFSVGKAMGHPWFQNFQMWCDLREFEQRMGYRYLTHEADDERWRAYALEKGLSFPEHSAAAANEEHDQQPSDT
uniref:Protein kinase D4 n=1 Tax=Cyprinus carpio TaxID=7962 RepID=A0A8C1X321_CYPCA